MTILEKSFFNFYLNKFYFNNGTRRTMEIDRKFVKRTRRDVKWSEMGGEKNKIVNFVVFVGFH